MLYIIIIKQTTNKENKRFKKKTKKTRTYICAFPVEHIAWEIRHISIYGSRLIVRVPQAVCSRMVQRYEAVLVDLLKIVVRIKKNSNRQI